MKRITALLLMIFAITKTYAQNYQINFSGTGACTTIDSVKVENLTQCTDTTISGSDVLHLVASLGTNEAVTGSYKPIQIYPNPMTDYCLIDFSAPTDGKTTIELCDITGRRIIQVQELLTKGHHTYLLNGICNGLYFLKIVSGNYSYSAKIVSNNQSLTCRTEINQIKKVPVTDKQSDDSNTRTLKSLTNVKSLIDMQYTTDNILKLTGISGIYRTVFMLVPTQSQTVSFNFVACTDADNQNYSVVQIGTQLWMAENLNVGTMINSTTGGQLQTNNAVIEKYCYNNNLVNCNSYGGLYEWYETMQYNPSDTAMTGTTQGICPTGWHIPTHHEWTTLERAICTSGTCTTDFPYDFTTDGYKGTDEGGKLKDTCTTHWIYPNTYVTNNSGFTALPGGYRYAPGGWFLGLGYSSRIWSASESSDISAWYRYLYYNYANVYRGKFGRQFGFSVRCLKDN